MPVSSYFGRGRRYNEEGTEAVNLDTERKSKQHKKSGLEAGYSKGVSTEILPSATVEKMQTNWGSSKKFNPDRY